MSIFEKFISILKKDNDKELIAKKLVGSSEEDGEIKGTINPYTKKIATKYVKCNEEDAKRALEVAKEAFKNTKSSPLHKELHG